MKLYGYLLLLLPLLFSLGEGPTSSLTLEKERFRQILQNPTWQSYRKREITATLKAYNYLLDHLHIGAALLATRQRLSYQIRPLGPKSWQILSPWGIRAVVRLVQKSTTSRLYYAQGTLSYPHLPKVVSHGLIFLQHRPKGQGKLLCEARFYLRLQQQVLHFLAKPLLFLLDRWLQRELALVVSSSQQLSEELSRSPEKVYQALLKVSHISDKEKKAFFHHFLVPQRSGK